MKNEEVLQRMNKKKADRYLKGKETKILWTFETTK